MNVARPKPPPSDTPRSDKSAKRFGFKGQFVATSLAKTLEIESNELRKKLNRAIFIAEKAINFCPDDMFWDETKELDKLKD